jgi:hypothetical protein
MAKLKQNKLNDISIDIITTQSTKVPETYITIHQDGKTIFLEHSKIVDFLKTVNNFR